MKVDNSQEKGLYWLTGSQKFELMKNVDESLAGRISLLELSTLILAEKEGLKSKIFDPRNISNNLNISIDKIFEHIFMGGMPEYVVDKLDCNTFFEDYIRTYLERDVRQLA